MGEKPSPSLVPTYSTHSNGSMSKNQESLVLQWDQDPLTPGPIRDANSSTLCVLFFYFLLFFFFLTFKNDVCLPPSLPRFQVSPSVHSSLEPKARNSCLPHRPHFPPLLPSSSLEPSLLWMLLCEFPVWWVKTLGQPNEKHTSGHSLQGKSILELTAPPPQTDHELS